MVSYSYLVLVMYFCLLVALTDGSKRNTQSIYSPYGPKMCKELTRDTKAGFIFLLGNLSCIREEKELADVHKGAHGKPCKRDDDCIVNSSICHESVCLCKPGFYYSPTYNACFRGSVSAVTGCSMPPDSERYTMTVKPYTEERFFREDNRESFGLLTDGKSQVNRFCNESKECKEYGNKMDLYTGLSIKLHNTLLAGSRYTLLSKCCELCITETKFLCRTVDTVINEICILSKFGFLDVKEEDREYSPKWTLAQRQCK